MGGFDEHELREFMADNEALEVQHHFFEHEQSPWLVLVVCYRPNESTTSKGPKRDRREKPEAALDPVERERFEALRGWRKTRAQTDGVPVYVILVNRQLAEIAKTAPRSLNELAAVKGIGEARLERYGEDVLRILREAESGESAAKNAVNAGGEQ